MNLHRLRGCARCTSTRRTKVAQTDKISQTNKRNRMALTDEQNGSNQQTNKKRGGSTNRMILRQCWFDIVFARREMCGIVLGPF